jgi:ApaG protein
MVAPRTDAQRSSHAVTRGIGVGVTPRYLPENSDPVAGEWVFAYRVRIENTSDAPVRLVSRRWVIRDADGDEQIVEGEGVIGRQPHLAPGQSHEYESFCPLTTSWGTMEGHYTMRCEDGSEFDAAIGRFYLVAEDA